MGEARERISDATKETERREAHAEHGAPQEPTPSESAAAEENVVSAQTRERYEEMTDRGAGQQGEGRLP